MIRPCCGTPDDRRSPSPHARDCRAVPPAAPSGGPWCVSPRCDYPALHRAESPGCALADRPHRVEMHRTVNGQGIGRTVEIMAPDADAARRKAAALHRGYTIDRAYRWPVE